MSTQKEYNTQPEPDGEAVADVVRERLGVLRQRGRPSSLDDLDEIVDLERLLSARIMFFQQGGKA